MDAAKRIFDFIESAPKGEYRAAAHPVPNFHLGASALLTPVVAIGAAELPQIAERITAGNASQQDAEKLKELSGALWALWEKVRAVAAVLDGAEG